MSKSPNEILTFKGGIHPAGDGKSLSSAAPVQVAPLLDRYRVVISENVGKPPKPVVKVGDSVKKYQLIAAADGFVSSNLHSPTSGKVAAIAEVPGAMGVPVPAIEIEADGLDEAGELLPPIDWKNASPDELRKRIAEAGIVGMGGAAFPTQVKLSPPPEKKIDVLILNGAECEPYLTADHRLMLEQPERVLEGAAIAARILGVEKIFVGVEINKIDAIEALKKHAGAWNVKVVGLKVQYPQGSEKQLINAITGRAVPTGGLPMDAGCVVQNVGSAAAVADAVVRGIPLVERITTVTGEVVKNPGNWLLKLGTPVIKAVEFAGGVTAEPGKLILGGPMMGFAQKSFDVTVCKNTSGILLLPRSESLTYESVGCIRCGRCVQGCPMNLTPCALANAVEADRFDLALQNHVMDCLECGSCAYVCPAHRPLVQYMRRAKAEIRKRKK